MDDSATRTHPPPHFLWGLPQGWEGGDPTGQLHLSPFSSTSSDFGGSLECQEGGRRLNRGLTDSQAWSQGWRAVWEEEMGQDKGSIVRTTQEALDERVPRPQPEVLLQLQNQRLFFEAAGGVVIGTCFWKATWQQVVRVLNMFLPSTY